MKPMSKGTKKEAEECLEWAIEDLFDAANMYELSGDRDRARRVVEHARALSALRWVALSVLAIVLMGAAPTPQRVDRVHVSKSSRSMELYAGEALVARYKVAIGFGGTGPKTREGDGRTPVGTYHVVKHVPSHLRMFLALDYPNAADRMRFDAAKARGDIPSSATIGGDVGIHGEPPWAKPFKKATYSSHGCVVVEDAEIDAIARLVPDGALVEIEE